MKTNIVLKSPDRELFGCVVRQQTKTGFMSVTDLQRAFEKARYMYGWTDRSINDIIKYKAAQERVYYLLHERGFIKTTFVAFTEMTEREGIVNVLKGLGVWKTSGRGNTKAVFCDPYIWVLLAMELNPMIYAKVVVWLTDSLLVDRIKAGSDYRPMNAAIRSVVNDPDYARIAREINKAVFGHHERGIRDVASAEQLKRIAEIERYISNCIDDGFVRSEDDVIRIINKRIAA